MKNSRSTYVLIGLFLGGLLTLWGLERAGVLTESERARRRDRVLPDLVDLKEAEVRRLEIDGGPERLVFERLGPRSWAIRKPYEVDAAPQEVDRLISALKGLRKSPEAGAVEGAAADYGLAPPAFVVRLWTEDGPAAAPAATLEVGRSIQEERFVRAGPDAAVEVVSRRALAALDRPAVEWRETVLVPPSLAPIASIAVRRPGLDATAERAERGAWRLTSPIRFPADAARIEQLLAVAGAIRVDPRSGGFVAEGVRDFAPYGLAEPAAALELRPLAIGVEPVTLELGGSPPDHPDRVYVRKAGGDAVVTVDRRILDEIPAELNALRSRRIAGLVPSAVRRIEVESPVGRFDLRWEEAAWMLAAPVAARADQAQVLALLRKIEELQASEFLDPAIVPDPGIDPPLARIRIWQDAGTGGAAAGVGPVLDLRLGRHDVLRKVVFARAEGDTAILAIPDVFLSALPATSFAFRDLELPAVQPTSVARLTVVRPGRTTVLEPGDPSGAPNRWRMVEPAKADADARAVTAALARLADLRAGSFVADARGDLARFGLDSPLLEVRWEVRPSGSGEAPAPGAQSLRIGSAVPNDPQKYHGTLTDFPAVFTIDAASLVPFTAEFRDTRVLSFKPDAVRRLTLRTETRSLAYTRRRHALGTPADWSAEPGTPSQGVDFSRFDDLVEALSELRAERFIQYEGPFPPEVGLGTPRLDVRVSLDGDAPPARLRLGAALGEAYVCGATGEGDSGPVFILRAPAWEALIQSAEGGLPPLPADPFAPALGP
ncbi:DUF4340 domain-containing protein [Paludisphaera soli]|uniref:DUF4340 domain-containing protein n=1 Tax=Paludisphaera soli TaxID=2712865 RepID=UPI0013EE22F3|nr:DUF4340 domain-containing protein [Paludisphaera soli]